MEEGGKERFNGTGVFRKYDAFVHKGIVRVNPLVNLQVTDVLELQKDGG